MAPLTNAEFSVLLCFPASASTYMPTVCNGQEVSTPPPHLCDCELQFSCRVLGLLDESAHVQLQNVETAKEDTPSTFFRNSTINYF